MPQHLRQTIYTCLVDSIRQPSNSTSSPYRPNSQRANQQPPPPLFSLLLSKNQNLITSHPPLFLSSPSSPSTNSMISSIDALLLSHAVTQTSSFRSSGGETWIPICLPGWNSERWVFVYVSFFGGDNDDNEDCEIEEGDLDMGDSDVGEMCLVLVSERKDAFFEMAEVKTRFIEVSLYFFFFLPFF